MCLHLATCTSPSHPKGDENNAPCENPHKEALSKVKRTNLNAFENDARPTWYKFPTLGTTCDTSRHGRPYLVLVF